MYEAQKKYAKNNLVKLAIDVKPELRRKFRETCEANGAKPSKVLKEFVENYIKKNSKNA